MDRPAHRAGRFVCSRMFQFAADLLATAKSSYELGVGGLTRRTIFWGTANSHDHRKGRVSLGWLGG